MPRYTYPMTSDGPIVPIVIGLDQAAVAILAAAAISIPAPFHGKAIIDTGSNVTAVSASFLHAFQLIQTSGLQTVTASGPAPARIFKASLSILPPSNSSGPLLTHPSLIVMELTHPPDECDVLIGRDVLDHYDFHYDGPNRLIHITF